MWMKHKRALLVGSALLLIGGGVRGEDKPKREEKTKEQIQQVIKRWKEAQPGHREVIPDELSDTIRPDKVKSKGQPLVLGETAPKVEGLPAERPLALVFYRGHW